MKNKILVILGAVLALTFSGCDISDLMPLQDSVSEHTVTASTPAQTNIVDGVEVVTPAQEYVYHIPITNKIVSPGWTHSIEVAQGLNQLNPTPTAPLITLALGGLSFVLGAIARIQSNKANRAGAVVDAVIDGVEKANDPKVKELIRQSATNAGVQADLHAAVKENT